MGEKQIKEKLYPEIVAAGIFLFPFSKFTRILNKHAMRVGEQLFSCVNHHTEYVAANHIRITLTIMEGYNYLQEFFLISKGTWYQVGRKTRKGFALNLTWIDRGVVFDITCEKEGFIFKLKRKIRWIFFVSEVLAELNQSKDALLIEYNKLEESKKLLEKQSTLLNTAYEITKSIRQSLNFEATLDAITNALITEAKFSFAVIRLRKDIEGNDFHIEVSKGDQNPDASPVTRQIIIDGKTIGELEINPGSHTDSADMDELLGYLMPVICISIHDALVLRTVIDYRDNLEAKVEERTSKLKKAEDELSKTISLLQEAQESQNRFFTNISHEFRTPLTLILGPVKQIAEQLTNEKIKEELEIVYKNAKKLLFLVNQLLDLSKIESGSMKLRTSYQSIIQIMKTVTALFMPYAERKRISFIFNSNDGEINAYIDSEKIESIVTNVLANAFKFTPEGGRVDLSVSRNDHAAIICVSDTGIGIPKDKLIKIFDRFYQVEGGYTRAGEGTGIGLALTKELVELHKGSIRIESEEGKGTDVFIHIPLGKKHLLPEEILEKAICEVRAAEIEIPLSKTEEIHKEEHEIDLSLESIRPSVLLVEDNSDVRTYIKGNLEREHQMFEAIDGEEGWNKATEYLPDIIISDVMMPKMDGFELCEKLKTDERTSHIPVILLTAKAGCENKIKGFETGADAYITKPFEPEELKARIRNLIEQRKRIHCHFQKNGFLGLDDSTLISIDKKFLQKVLHIITENISNTSFSVESLAEQSTVSRSVLHKKIVSLIGEPPVELIRRIRLMKAAEMITKNCGNISEIALDVGFTNPAYFSECFKKQFGVSPSHYSHTSL